MRLATSRLITKIEFGAQSVLRYPLPLACPYCGGGEQTTVARKAAVVRLQRCMSCSLQFTRPIYRTWLSGNFYDALYAAEGSTTTLPSEAEVRELRDRNFAGTDKDATERIANMRAAAGLARSVLEIGSSWGYFLYQAQQAGWSALGIEIGLRRRAFGERNLAVNMVTSIEDIDPARKFDVVYSSHALEHFTDVSKVFQQVADRLTERGHFFVEVPNVDIEAVGPRALGWMGAVHPIGYDAAFFVRNLPRHGFSRVAIYDDWAAVPSRPVKRSTSAVLIVHAQRG